MRSPFARQDSFRLLIMSINSRFVAIARFLSYFIFASLIDNLFATRALNSSWIRVLTKLHVQSLFGIFNIHNQAWILSIKISIWKTKELLDSKSSRWVTLISLTSDHLTKCSSHFRCIDAGKDSVNKRRKKLISFSS